MTGREITQMAFELKEPPRLPVTVIGGGAWNVHLAGKTFAGIKEDPEKIAEVFIQAYEGVGHDLLWSGSNFINYPIHFLGCPIKDDSSDGPALLGTVIKSLKEVESLSIQKVMQTPTMQGIIHSHHLVAAAIGKKTLVMPTQWAPFSCAARILGVEAVMTATIEDPEGLLRLLDFSTKLTWAVLGPILEHPDILGANFSDPVASGDMISPPTFRKFAAPFLKELVKRVQAKGKYAMIHVCGDTSRILQDIVDIGPNCFSLEKKVDLRAAKRVLGGKVCVAGNISPTGAFLTGKPEEVVSEARECVEAWGKGGGFILTLGCDFAKAVPLENILALMSMKR
ncbi:MAG: uroporphyrinogen decarboxylase family protein [Deltaproteobacteria bacterium]|nr:uroporphyrinogen decarboxylase family protein [Deltaproteobacteria bacterium]